MLDIPGAVVVKRRVFCVCSLCPGGVLVVVSTVFEAAVEDADEAVAEGAECLVVSIAGGAALVVVVAAGGLLVSEQKAHWSMASWRRRLRTWQASTRDFLPLAIVIGDVPA